MNLSVPGLMAAAICAVGFAIGVFSLLNGLGALAVAALGVAVMGTWFGLAWVARAQRGPYNAALPSRD
ncbi:hypothetical protein [Mycobacterium sp.]|uniref:hypothetical protein n=2 Tax=Mycobacterium sp. TaxID=1785 RepID=UPI003F97B7C7